MIYNEETIIEALGVVPSDLDGHGIVMVYEMVTEEATMRVSFHQYDDEVVVEWLLPSGRCGTRIRVPGAKGLRSVKDPHSKFLEVRTSETTIEIWFSPAPRVHVLAAAS